MLTSTATWEKVQKQTVGFKVSVSEGHENPLEHHIGRTDANMLYVKFGCGKFWPAYKFLSAMDGPADTLSRPGWLGILLTSLWFGSCPLLLFGLFQWRDCRRMELELGKDNVVPSPLWKVLFDDVDEKDLTRCHTHADTFTIISSVLALPGYLAEISTFQVSVMRMVWLQWECKLIMFQNILSSVLFSALLRDWRVLTVWCNIFVGITEIAFSDAIPVRESHTPPRRACAADD